MSKSVNEIDDGFDRVESQYPPQNESQLGPEPKTREERMAEAQARAEARKGTLIEYIPPMDMTEPLRTVQQFSLDQIIIKTKFDPNWSPEKIAELVKREFNKDTEEHKVIVDAGARSGERLEPGFYCIAHRNRVPQLEIGRGQRLTLKLTGGYTETAFLGPEHGHGHFKMTDPCVGGFGSHILNIPQGKVGKVWLGNTPKIYGEGIHVVHDPLFKQANESGNWLQNIADQQIQHGNLHVLRVPASNLAKVIVETHSALLPYRKEPYCFDTALFEFKGLVSEDTALIQHSPLHLIRVPAGSVGTAWLGSRPILLEYREEPYYFDDPLFRFEPRQGSTTAAKFGQFYDAQEKFIRHGAINRLRPGVKGDLEVAVVQCDGNLEFIEHATMMDNANWAVLGFLNMGLRTHVFPSKQTRDERRRENSRATAEEINFEPMTTKDSLKVGLKLLVAFQVADPHALMRCLRLGDVTEHVENLAVSDMARAVQNSTSQNFLNSSHHDHKTHDRQQMEEEQEPPAAVSIADKVKAQLSEHLLDCGIKLVRFNVEEAKVLDEELAKEMSKQALVAATASAQQSVIEQKAAVARSNAELEAMARRVKQDQENLIRISAAEAELEAQKLAAQGILVKAEAERKAKDLLGEMYQKYPELLQLELAKVQMAALGKSSVTFVAPELGKTPFGAANAFGIAGMPGNPGE